MESRAIVGGLAGTLLALVAGLAWSFPSTPCAVATAECRTVSFNNGLISAQVTFQWDNNGTAALTDDLMYVSLSNTSLNTTPYNINDVLTGLFFTLKDSAGNYAVLTEKYADIEWANIATAGPTPVVNASGQETLVKASDGTTLLSVNQTTESDAGSEWAYKDAATGKLYEGFKSGVSSTTLGGLFSTPTFCGTTGTGNSIDGDTSSACGSRINSITLNSGGSGYGSANAAVPLGITGLTCNVAPTATGARNSSGTYTSITITNPGSGCTGSPTITFPGGGTGASATAALDSPLTVDGLQYGLVGSAFTGFTPATTSNLPVQVQDSVLLKFATNGASFDLTKAGALNVGFQYGDSKSGLVTLPEPSTIALFGLGALLLGWRRRKQAELR